MKTLREFHRVVDDTLKEFAEKELLEANRLPYKPSRGEIDQARAALLSFEASTWPEPGSLWKTRGGEKVKVTRLSRPERLVHAADAGNGGSTVIYRLDDFWECHTRE